MMLRSSRTGCGSDGTREMRASSGKRSRSMRARVTVIGIMPPVLDRTIQVQLWQPASFNTPRNVRATLPFHAARRPFEARCHDRAGPAPHG